MLGSCVCLAEPLLWFVIHRGSSATDGGSSVTPALLLLLRLGLGCGVGSGTRGLSSGAPGNEVRYQPVHELTVHCFSICRNLQILLEFRFWKPVQRMPQM